MAYPGSLRCVLMNDPNDYAAGLVALAEAWDRTGYIIGGPIPDTSPCVVESTRLPDNTIEPDALMRAIATDAATYLAAASQHLRALAALLEAGPAVVISGWSLTRTAAEYCARANWLTAPADGMPNDTLNRIARFYMERVFVLHHAKQAAKAQRDSPSEKKLKARRERMLEQARLLLPDAAMPLQIGETSDLDWAKWSVGGQRYAGLSQVTNQFGRTSLGERGLYDALSANGHPSLSRLAEQTGTVQLLDRRYSRLIAKQETIRWQVQVACSVLYWASGSLVAYLAVGETPLQEWASSHRPLLLTASSKP